MKPNALFPFVLLVVGYSAQAADSPRPADPPVSHFQGVCDSDPDGKKFAEKACYTSDNPADAGYRDEYRSPACDKGKPLTDQQRQMLAKAYSRSPDYMKGKLCRLTQLFVTEATTEGPMGWGFWEGADRPPGKGVFVAVSASELRTSKSVAERENETFDMLLQVRGGGKRARPARLNAKALPDPELTVLVGLAHELGHALLADSNADGVNADHPRREVSGPPQSSCFEDAFIGPSWDAERFHHNMTRWVEFGVQNHNRQKNPDVRFSLNRLRTSAERGRLDGANVVLKRVFGSREFVSFAAAVRPEEDFVETYKYKVLLDAGANKSIEFQLGRLNVSVAELLKSDVLSKKVECLRALGMLTGQP
jgi:hypothetical protein